MRVFLTGSEGMIGRWLGRWLGAAGCELLTLDRREGGGGAPWVLRHTVGDLAASGGADAAALEDALRGCDAVVHAARCRTTATAPKGRS
jgi:nucleoside-diphosphate-sugar epimerase